MYDGHTIEKVIREINKELVPEFKTKLRFHLEKQDKAWLIEQIIQMAGCELQRGGKYVYSGPYIGSCGHRHVPGN